MRSTKITLLPRSPCFLRTIAGLVLITFGSLLLNPTFLAAQQLFDEPEDTAPATETDDALFADTLEKIEDRLARLQERLAKAEETELEERDLKRLRKRLLRLDDKVLRRFDKLERKLKKQGLPPEILERHQAMVATYERELAKMVRNLDALAAARNDIEREDKVEQVLEQMEGDEEKRRAQPLKPEVLPNRSLRPNPENTPKLKKDDFSGAGLYNNPTVKLAAVGDFRFNTLAGADDPAYLAGTDEVVLSDAIKAKAAELEHQPIKIYNWVRNNIEWLPTWGAMQDADLTLAAGRGNAFDIASLLLALLRASGIPARYVHGTVEIPAERFMNWAGGFKDIQAATDYAASGGIPITSVITGGKVTKVRMEHIWVEAAIDFYPSRGARNREADSWIALDTSFKQYTFKKGLDMASISGLDPEALAQSFIQSGTINEEEAWVSGFDPRVLETAQNQARQTLEQHINDHLTNPTVGDVIGGKTIASQDLRALPTGLPYKLLVTGARYGALPSQLQHQMSLAFASDILGDPIDPITFPWSRLNNQKVTLSFKPATEADEQALEALLPEGEITDLSQLPTRIPAYLIRVIPELAVNNEVVKQGTAMTLGEELPFTVGITLRGQGEFPYIYNVIAGSYLSVAVIGGNVSPVVLEGLQTKVAQTKTTLESNDPDLIAGLTREDLLGDLFYAGTLGYYAQYITLSELAGLQQGAHHYLAAGYGTFGYEPNVDTFFGIPRAIETGGVAMNIPMLRITGTDTVDAEQRKQFNIQAGILSSALEHAVPEQMFVNEENPGEAISAVKALTKATEEGQRTYHITPTNQNQTLLNIHHRQETMDEIRAALQVGKEVITHTDPVSVPGWTGAGYIIIDPGTGDGAYKIGGGQNGGFIFALVITMIAFIVGFFLLQQSLLIGGLILLWEGVNFRMWIDAIKSANSLEEFNKANFGQSVVSMLGLAAAAFEAEAAVVIWFGMLFSFLLTNVF